MLQLGGRVLTLSDSGGFIHDPDGVDEEKLAWVKELKEVRRGRIAEYAQRFSSATFHEGQRPWAVPCDVALPCATQNELDGDDARTLVTNGCRAVAEGANMPTELDAVHVFREARTLFAPGKAANAGGVAVSGLEMSQNSTRVSWDAEELQRYLVDIMSGIHDRCVEYGRAADGEHVDYVTRCQHRGVREGRGRHARLRRRVTRRQPVTAMISASTRAAPVNTIVAMPTTRAAVGWIGLSPARSGPWRSS